MIGEGMLVEILPSEVYANKFAGKRGVVENAQFDTVGIRIKNAHNPRSSKGLFWFPKDIIKIIESENYFMKSEKFIVAGIKFQSGTNTDKEYFYALYDATVEVGDLVVVQTGHHGFAVARVSSIGERDAECVECGREIVSKVDLSAYETRVHKRESIKTLKSEMDKKIKELQEMAIYELLAKEDDSLAAMLTDYKRLLG